MHEPNRSLLSAGIDEAGRGCVLGPLVVAIVVATPADRRWFAAQNVRDSKLVPPVQRERLAREIRARCWFRLKVATPLDIDIAVRDRSRTLNGLELEHMAECLDDAHDAFGDEQLKTLVDAPSINAEGFRKKLFEASSWTHFDHLEAKHHADTNNRTVGAASILAKDERERHIALLKEQLECDFGSGYCHDERTIAHLKNAPSGADYVRWSWATAQRHREGARKK